MWQYIISFMVITSSVLFVYFGNHLLNSLIVLENIVLLIYLTMIISYSSSMSGAVPILVLFVMTVSSASVGLSILVSLARSHGNDLFAGNNILW